MIPRSISWVTAFADAKSDPVSQTHMLRRLFSGERKARRFPSGEIAASLIFGLSKKSFRGISGGLLVPSAIKNWPAHKPQVTSCKIAIVLIQFLQGLVEI